MNRKLLLFICLLLIANCQLIFGQQSGSASVSAPDSNRIDTNYVKIYTDKLVIGLYQSERSFNITIDQKITALTNTSSAINYIANSNHVSGISVDYDVIGFAFGYRSLPGGNARTGSSKYLDLGFNINTRRFRFENSFRNYTGFYDNNSANYTHPFTDSTPYFQNPSMNLRVIKSKLIYTFNKRKFALSSAYANVKRQVKSHGSWLLIANFYSLSLNSDSSMIPPALRKDYGTVWDGLNKMNVYAYSAGFGGTYTLVFWKRFYLNFLFSYGIETQYRHYYTSPDNAHYSYWIIEPAADSRISFGYNAKRFFMRISSIYDINDFESTELKFNMQFFAGSFDLGYRFNLKTPKPYKKFQETKIYKML